ncbi:coiled-coil domain-containing protein 152 [Odontesthes bonariensis]|uniref:coiled-coil domain-containing protein 152 n=1 Tax=Odontesthes bonariensis TaxID=219752 RepID=UPI003F58C9F0
MTKFNCVNLDEFMADFGQLEQTITKMNGKNSMLEIMMEDANRLMKFYLSKEKSLAEEKDGLLVTVNKLQQTLEEQCNLRVENERLKNEVVDLKQLSERRVEAGEAEVQRLLGRMRAEEERHQRELQAARQQCSGEVERAHREALRLLEAKDRDVQRLMEEKDLDLQEMKKRLKDQERERQSELLKLQMEFGAKLARVQNTAQQSQQQQQQLHGPSMLPQSVYKRVSRAHSAFHIPQKLQFFQEEKNKEIGALRQRIRELEEHQRASSLADGRLKRRKM